MRSFDASAAHKGLWLAQKMMPDTLNHALSMWEVDGELDVAVMESAFLRVMDEAEVEHEGAKRLIAEIEASGPDDDYYDAKVTVLSEMIKHHVKEEEKPGGMFSEARDSDMDLAELGEQLAARKEELEAQGEMPSPGARQRGESMGTRARRR